MNGERGTGQPPLQGHQREAHVDPLLATALLDGIAVGAVHLLTHVFSHLFVEHFLRLRELVLGGVAAAFGEQLGSREGVEVFFHQPAHQVGGVAAVHGVLLLPREAVLIQQGHEQLEVLVLAVVRRRRHQQEVAGMVTHPLAHVVALSALHLTAEVVGAHAVGFIEHHQVPFGGLLQPGLQLRIARELIHAGDQQRPLREGIAQAGGVDQVAGEQLELQLELLLQLVLPLLRQGARRHDQTALQLSPDQQFLDQQTGHDRLACAGVVRQQEAHWLAGEHVLVDRADLVGQRVDRAAANRHIGIEQVGQPNPFGLRHQPEQLAVPLEAPLTATRDQFQIGFAAAKHDRVASAAVLAPVKHLAGHVAHPLDADQPHGLLANQALDQGVGFEVFQAGHWVSKACQLTLGI